MISLVHVTGSSCVVEMCSFRSVVLPTSSLVQQMCSQYSVPEL